MTFLPLFLAAIVAVIAYVPMLALLERAKSSRANFWRGIGNFFGEQSEAASWLLLVLWALAAGLLVTFRDRR